MYYSRKERSLKMGDTLSKSLAKFISNNNDFSDPFEDNNELPKSSSTKEFIKNYGKKGKNQDKNQEELKKEMMI